MADGKKISTRQRRKILELNIPDKISSEHDSPTLVILYIKFDPTGSLNLVQLLSRVDPKCNPHAQIVNKGRSKKREKHRTMGPKNKTGSTPLRPALSTLICNLAKLKKGSFCMDPFVGSGCLAKASKGFGAFMLGSDALNVGNMEGSKFERVISNVYHHDPCIGLGILSMQSSAIHPTADGPRRSVWKSECVS